METTRTTNLLKDPRGAYSYNEMMAIIDAAKNNMRDYALLTTLAFTGRRINEVVRSLKPKDIDAENKLIFWTIEKQFNKRSFWQPKTRVVKAIPVMTGVLSVLQGYITARGIPADAYVFPISSTRVWVIVKRYSKIAGVVDKKRIVHAFRHGFALAFAERSTSPLDIDVLNQLLAHPFKETTMFYFRYKDKKPGAMLDDMFGSKDADVS